MVSTPSAPAFLQPISPTLLLQVVADLNTNDLQKNLQHMNEDSCGSSLSVCEDTEAHISPNVAPSVCE